MPRRPAILWQAQAQTPLLRRLVRTLDLQIDAIGSPDPTKSGQIAADWAASPDGQNPQPLTDLRAAIATAQRGTLILLADPGPFGAPAPGSQRPPTRLDVEELDAAEERGVKVVSIEPIPAGLQQLAEAGPRITHQSSAGGHADAHISTLEWAMLSPLTRFARSIQELIELLPSVGPVRQLTLHTAGAPCHGSLGARLFDAADLATLILGPETPESVHAVFTAPAPTTARGLHAGPPQPDHLRGLDGDLAATLRYPGNKAAAITATSRAADFAVDLTLLAANATATIKGSIGGGASRLIVHHHDQPAPAIASTPSRPDEDPFIDLLASQITRYLDSGVGLAGRVDFAATLALCQAALLSARTGEPESPATMRRLAAH